MIGTILNIKSYLNKSKLLFLIKDYIIPYTQNEPAVYAGWTRAVKTISGLFFNLNKL